jgi:uncharacterized protein YdgA (DUF945 family)
MLFLNIRVLVMKKSVRITVGLALVAMAAGAASAWYTGQQLEANLHSAIAEGNQQLQSLAPGVGLDVTVELLSLQRGLFSSTAHYRLKARGELSLGDGEATSIDDELLFVDHIEHGPFPLSRLLRLQLTPVFSKSTLQLENTPLVAKWFVAANGVAPLRAEASVGYDGNVSSTLDAHALSYSEGAARLEFSGLQLDAQISAAQQQFNIDGVMEHLLLADDGQTHIELQGLRVRNNSNMGASGLYLGSSDNRLQRLQVQLPERPLLAINDMQQTGQLAEGQDGVEGQFTYGFGMLSLAGQDLAALQMTGSVQRLDTQAINRLSVLYKQLVAQVELASSPSGPAELALDAEQQNSLEGDVNTLLAAKPLLALDNLTLTTANGQSSLKLSLVLDKPSSFALPPEVVVQQAIASLQGHLQVSKAMLKDLLMAQAALAPAGDPVQIKQHAEQFADMAAMMAVGTQMAVVNGDNIITDLKYAHGQVELNGQSMTLQAFMTLGMGLAGDLPQP